MSAAPTLKVYKDIMVTKPSEAVWISPIGSYETHQGRKKDIGTLTSHVDDYIILIGPTGSGKSSFIEAIASRSMREPLGIAKDQLESVTQEACIYEIKNLSDSIGDKIFIIDTPGFADPRISELQVLDKITHWRDECQANNGYIRLLYFHPITDIRMPASRKQCIDIIKRFWGSRLSGRAVLVTSMWDRVPERSRNEMEKRFTQLSTSHWGDWAKEGSPIVKFENTFDSAMEILDMLCNAKSERSHFPEVSGLGMDGTTDNPGYDALLSRISSLEQKRQSLLDDLVHPESQSQTELMSILTKDLAQTELFLHKFTAEMEDFLERFGQPQKIETSAAEEVIDPNPTDVAGSVNVTGIDAVPTAVHAVDSAAHSPDALDTMSTRDAGPVYDIGNVGGQQHASSLPKRFSRWINGKVNKLNLGSSGRKGA